MTFDDGILIVYTVENGAAPGNRPVYQLSEKLRSYYRQETLGITRYYTAKQANQQIAAVVAIPDHQGVKVTDLVALDGGGQYVVQLVQATKDENGLKITRLSLEEVKQNYELPTETA